MLFIQQNTELNHSRITFEFDNVDDLNDKLKYHFPKQKYIDKKGEIESTFYPTDYNYHMFLTSRQTKKGKSILFGRILAKHKVELQEIEL